MWLLTMHMSLQCYNSNKLQSNNRPPACLLSSSTSNGRRFEKVVLFFQLLSNLSHQIEHLLRDFDFADGSNAAIFSALHLDVTDDKIA